MSIYEAVFLSHHEAGPALRMNGMAPHAFWQELIRTRAARSSSEGRHGLFYDFLRWSASVLQQVLGTSHCKLMLDDGRARGMRGNQLVGDGLFIERYVAFQHFRSKGWIVKSGLRHGADFGEQETAIER